MRLSSSVVLAAALSIGGARALDWTSSHSKPAFAVAGGDKIRGVNLGGWLILENWMTSALFGVPPLDKQVVPDEWTYCLVLGKQECAKRLEEHWSTYITEEDFQLIQAAGLNTVRIPIGYWAFDLIDEPYVQGQIKHMGNALHWAKKYSIDVMVDLHGLPGSQNGLDNAGWLTDTIHWQDNTTNVDRSINALELLTVEVTKPEYEGVVKSIEVINEPFLDTGKKGGATFDQLADYYVRSYKSIRAKETILDGAAPVTVVIHDAFQPVLNWGFFFGNASLGGNWVNFALDIHIYQAFNGQDKLSHEEHLATMCARTADIAEASKNYTVIVGEWSLGTKTYCVDYQTCFKTTMAQNLDASKEESIFTEKYWEVQANIYESAAGWNGRSAVSPIYRSIVVRSDHAGVRRSDGGTERVGLVTTWSFFQSQKQGWIPSDLSARSYTFDASSSDQCLVAQSDAAATPTFPLTYVGSSASSTANSAGIKQSSASGAQLTTSGSGRWVALLGAIGAGGLVVLLA